MSVWRKNNSDQSIKKSWSLDEAKEKLSTFCAYQERCIWETRRKLYEKGIKDSNSDELIDYLIQEKFIDEERYARSFTRGKFRLKKWGRGRISRELKMRQISEGDIRKGLSEIDPHEYYDTLLSQVDKHWERIKESDPYKKKYKLIHYLISKGFEQDLIKEAIEEAGFED
ncbi:regulatory protein RecX [Algoriphagus sp.]|uniref:regulatory protein RecX n=1 Tax=Algoriphagus sp. TaxID=1872435 RepID=UPI0025FC4CA9|nr:regulatory protein RecX [Algoriphagus sp.]